MALTVKPVSRPADLVNQPNGKIASPPLIDVTFPGRGTGKLHIQCARSWRAFSAACAEATGHTLTVTSWPDAYRNFDRQLSTFLARYEPISWATYLVTPASRRKIWASASSYGYSSRYWRLRRGFAMAAVPGTSNHGWGLALDVAILVSGAARGITTVPAVWGWVLANADRYGFSWEVQSEPWHLRLYTGDQTPAAVLAFEEGVKPPTQPGGVFVEIGPVPTLRLGAPNEPGWVRRIQRELLFAFNQQDVRITGVYDQATAEGVTTVQTFLNAIGIDVGPVDGVCGPRTIAGIYSVAP